MQNMQSESNSFLETVGSKFVTLPGEKLILAQRKHWYSFVFPIFIVAFIAIASIFGLIILSPIFPSYIQLLFSSALFIAIAAATFIGKLIVDWYLNFYIITSKKIIEVSYKPLTSRHTNEILLDQVKCTEIDTRVDGPIHELLDIGDVIITFDRPTHQEEFILADMSDPKKMEANLENALCPMQESDTISQVETKQANWFNKARQEPSKWRYLEEIRARGAN